MVTQGFIVIGQILVLYNLFIKILIFENPQLISDVASQVMTKEFVDFIITGGFVNRIILTAAFSLALGFVTSVASAAQLPVCIDHTTGMKVPIITNQQINNPAYSTLDPLTGKPEIFIDVRVLSQLNIETSQDTLQFIVEHECGHVNLGHLSIGRIGTKKTNQEELDADCYAAKAVKKMGYTPLDMEKVVSDVERLPKDPAHPAGTVRAANLMRCYNAI